MNKEQILEEAIREQQFSIEYHTTKLHLALDAGLSPTEYETEVRWHKERADKAIFLKEIFEVFKTTALKHLIKPDRD